MKTVCILVNLNPGNQHSYPTAVLAAEKAFRTKNQAIAYKEKGGDPKLLETVQTAEILEIPVLDTY
jgi:hypothetical protein